ncbi:hypothetical protein ACFVSN_05645 [Kitasatospora sp. NPDC057904]|uniref:hypothetical protein n=1 Tax=unclassified Kitasatospora TaxID=2633591 RepID=UPI0036DE2CA8
MPHQTHRQAGGPSTGPAGEGGAPARRGRGRRPADEVHRDILAAAGTVLFGEGMAGLGELGRTTGKIVLAVTDRE